MNKHRVVELLDRGDIVYLSTSIQENHETIRLLRLINYIEEVRIVKGNMIIEKRV